jgi:two-component system chemotaxis response regulator CheY
MKYLIVDDSRMARKMIIKVLKEFITTNVEIIQASNGKEAIELYKEFNPDLCFMDLTMSIMDGFDATLEIKNYDNNAKIFVISADVQEGALRKAKDNGALGFVNKPIDSSKMKTILSKMGHI